jgi:hypothetical protein
VLAEIGRQCERPVAPELQILCDQVRARFGDTLAAVLFYGSCLRSGDPTDGLVDLYVLVDRYSDAYQSRVLRTANACLPPNVFLLQTRTVTGRAIQAKYAVLSLADFEAGAGRWFQSYVWGRFAQPSRLVYSRDDGVRERVYGALAQAVVMLLRQTLPCMPDRFGAEAIWRCGLALSYGTELRPEAPGRPAQLVRQDAAYFDRLTAAAAPAVAGIQPVEVGDYHNRLLPAERRQGRRRWRLRRLQGRLLHLMRLMKSVLTFDNGVDYLAWKLERHTGQPIEVTPRLRRHPLIFGWPLLWRLLRERRLR